MPPCGFTNDHLVTGTEPNAGSCGGPLARTMAKRAALAKTACGLSSVPFLRDGDPDQLQCGDCVPGMTFAEDGACTFGQFCTDNATCATLHDHPLLGAPCPYDQPFAHTRLGPCGAGLRCVSHTCVQCRPQLDVLALASCSDSATWVVRNNSTNLGNVVAPATVSLPDWTFPVVIALSTLVIAACAFTAVRACSRPPSPNGPVSVSTPSHIVIHAPAPQTETVASAGCDTIVSRPCRFRSPWRHRNILPLSRSAGAVPHDSRVRAVGSASTPLRSAGATPWAPRFRPDGSPSPPRRPFDDSGEAAVG
jgi:hypothetical protein